MFTSLKKRLRKKKKKEVQKAQPETPKVNNPPLNGYAV